MKFRLLPGLVAGLALAFAAPAFAQDRAQTAQAMPKIVIGMSGWTGFAPLSLAANAGLFKKNGVDAEIRMVPQLERHLALASGAVQAVATTVDTQIFYASTGVNVTQVLVLDRSNGGDGIAARASIGKIADLKGKTVGVDGPGSTPYFMLSYMLKRNGLSVKDVTVVRLAPQPAATAFVAGQNDAAVTYEPYLSQVRANPQAGKILTTTVDYPVVVDTLAFQPDFIAKNPAIVKGVIAGFFDALAMIEKEPAKSYEIMGAVVKQSGEQFAGSAKFIKWLNRAENVEYMGKGLPEFIDYAAQIQLENGVTKATPDLKQLIDASFVRASGS